MARKALTLSIVIPVYNEEDYLEGCLDAIAHQSIMPDEVIIVDNNSSDRSMEIAKRYGFVKIVKETKQGIPHARDRGFNAARSDIIGRIDGDSILPVYWVARVKQFYNHPLGSTQAISGGGFFYNCRFPELSGFTMHYVAFYLNRLILGYHMLWGSNMAFRRSMWEEVKTDVCHNKSYHEDLDLGIHLRRHGYGISYRKHLKVGVAMKRVFHGRARLLPHLSQWPFTFRKHGFGLWWWSWVGVLFVYTSCYSMLITERFVDFFIPRFTLDSK